LPEEYGDIRAAARDVCDATVAPNAAETDETGRFPQASYTALCAADVHAPYIPVEYRLAWRPRRAPRPPSPPPCHRCSARSRTSNAVTCHGWRGAGREVASMRVPGWVRDGNHDVIDG